MRFVVMDICCLRRAVQHDPRGDELCSLPLSFHCPSRDGADADDDTSGIVFLPEGVWTRTRSKDGDSLSLTVGWLHAEGHQIVFQRDYVDRQLESVVFNSEDQHTGNN